MKSYLNKVFFKSSKVMAEIPDNSIDIVITSPPYFNIKDYSKDGKQLLTHSEQLKDDIGNLDAFSDYLENLLFVWKECQRVLKPNGKICINTPLMPIPKKIMPQNHTRHIYDIQSEIQHTILKNTNFKLMDLYIWNRTNSTKKLMFGSYPYPGNFYAQNTVEFITVFVKEGKPIKQISAEVKNKSKLTQNEWITFTKQIWEIPIPNKGDKAFGVHSAIMPEEIVKRCIKLFTFETDIVLDPFAGSGTTLKVAKENNRNFVGYEIYKSYREVMELKLNEKIED
jgi:DNA modification methylase